MFNTLPRWQVTQESIFNRREFLKSVGAASFIAATFTLTEESIRNVEAAAGKISNKSTEEAAQDEDFWRTIQQAFSIDRRFIPLNGGANNSSPRTVQEALIRYIEFVNGAPLRNQHDVLFPHKETARVRLAGLVHCSPEEIALTRNTTEALNTVIFGLDLQPSDEILTTNLEYYSMLNALDQRALRNGIKVKKISFPSLPCSPEVVLGTIASEITPATRVILISHIVDSNGQINPVQRICDLAHSRGIQVIVDGALSFGYIPVDLKAIGCDYYGTSLHKGMHAPLGTGFLYVKRENIQSLWPLYGSDEPANSIQKFESIGTHPVSQFAAINQALDFHEAIGTERKQARLHYLKTRWADQLKGSPNVEFHSSLEPDQSCGIVNVKVRNVDTVKLYQYLRDKHQILAWPIQEKMVEGLWVSPLIYSRLEDVDAFANVMLTVARKGLPG